MAVCKRKIQHCGRWKVKKQTKKVAVRLLGHKYEESRLWSYPRRAEFSPAALWESQIPARIVGHTHYLGCIRFASFSDHYSEVQRQAYELYRFRSQFLLLILKQKNMYQLKAITVVSEGGSGNKLWNVCYVVTYPTIFIGRSCFGFDPLFLFLSHATNTKRAVLRFSLWTRFLPDRGIHL